MRYYWPDARIDKWGNCNRRTEIYNYGIQGLATAEIIPIALVFFWHRIRGLPIKLLNTVHDSLVSKVREDFKEEYKQIAIQAMTHDVFKFLKDIYRYEFKVPLGVGMKISKNWGYTKEEVVYNVFQDGTMLLKE